jgi:aryl-alcohol dehydrogenase-like predicted oxidoreductase
VHLLRWIKQAVELSLQRLQTDYIDLYQLHHPFPDTDFEETLGVLSDLVREGKIRYIGTSNHQAWQIAEAQAISERYRLQRFVSEEASYSILNRGIEKDITEVTRRYDVGILAYGALAAGLLTGKYTAGQAADGNSRAARYKGYALGQILDPERPENRRKFAIIEELQELANRAGMTLAHMAVAFTQSHPSVTSTILGPRTPEQLRTFLAGTEIRLGSGLLDAIDGIVAPGSMVDELD